MASTQGYEVAPMDPAQPQVPPQRPGLIKKGKMLGGVALGLGCVGCLMVVGAFGFLVPGAILISWLDDDDDDPEDLAPGVALVIIGALLVVLGVLLCVVVKRKYRRFQAKAYGTPGRVISTAPQPAPPQPQPQPQPLPQPQATEQPPPYATAPEMVVPDPTVPEGHMYPYVPPLPTGGELPPKAGMPSDQPPPYSP